MAAQAGWYVDPRDARQYRYWDGERWSQSTQPIPEPTDTAGANDSNGVATGSLSSGGAKDPVGAAAFDQAAEQTPASSDGVLADFMWTSGFGETPDDPAANAGPTMFTPVTRDPPRPGHPLRRPRLHRHPRPRPRQPPPGRSGAPPSRPRRRSRRLRPRRPPHSVRPPTSGRPHRPHPSAGDRCSAPRPAVPHRSSTRPPPRRRPMPEDRCSRRSTRRSNRSSGPAITPTRRSAVPLPSAAGRARPTRRRPSRRHPPRSR